MKKLIGPILFALLAVPLVAQTNADGDAAQRSFAAASADSRKRLDDSLAELAALRQQMAEDTIPLSRRLSELESQLAEVRVEFQQTSRLLDNRTLDLSNLATEIKARHDESSYVSNLLAEYIRNFESRLHIAELQHYQGPLQRAKLAAENTALPQEQVFRDQAELLAVSVERLHDALGGMRFSGTAVDPGGVIRQGTFLLVGPAALFLTDDGLIVGTAEQRLGSVEPAVIPFETTADAAAATQLVTTSRGKLPLDPTLGNAHKIEETKETILEHVKKGGPVMVPIFSLAGLALLVALYKWLRLSFVRRPSRKSVLALLEAVSRRDRDGAVAAVARIRGPVGKMLSAGVDHLDQPRDLIEEVMYESVLSTRLQLQSFLPFVAITASAAPLLGLLGTVTGIMNTFTLMTVFGTGDVKTLSSGISEALITTEFGLYVAIPSLLIYAFLSRKTRGVVDQMEKAAVAFANQVSKTPLRAETVELQPLAAPAVAPAAVPVGVAAVTAQQVREILADMQLVPVPRSDAAVAAGKAPPENHAQRRGQVGSGGRAVHSVEE